MSWRRKCGASSAAITSFASCAECRERCSARRLPAMPRANIKLRLEGRAVDIALSPRRAGSVELTPHARAILEHAELGPSGSLTRIVVCTVAEARALLD